MCTVTFLPGLPRSGYLLATNRDESPRRRPALPPFAAEIGGRLVLAPRDGDAGGTWVGVDESGFALTVLNGDRPAAAPAPAEPISRGTLVMELLERRTPREVMEALRERAARAEMTFRPFKLVAVAPGAGGAAARLWRAEWDGKAIAFTEHDGAQCITSSGFEPDEVERRRGRAFAELMERVAPKLRGAASADDVDALADELHEFHASHAAGAPDGDAYTVCMHRAEARTVSSTLIVVSADSVRMDYQPGWPCKDGELSVTELERR
jgi:Transport and Golgi organisation 2